MAIPLVTPPLDEALMNEAWEAAVALIRARGDDPQQLLIAAARRVDEWRGPHHFALGYELGRDDGYVAGKEDGKREERNAIVSYLRGFSERLTWGEGAMRLIDAVMTINHGGHRPGEPR